MKLKIFTLPFDPSVGGFDDAPVQRFLEEREVLGVQEHFFVHEQQPTWALLLQYRDVDRPGEPPKERGRKKDWRATLSEPDRALFDQLRQWRNERAVQEGKPPFVLLTNAQLAAVVRLRPQSVEDLRKVRGVGKQRATDLAAELLDLISAAGGETSEVAPSDGQAGDA